MEEILDIFNDKLEIIGQDTRKNVHRKGLLHQVVHCWAIEDSKDGRFVYMQQRAEFKDFPLLFDITVGGHIDSGENIENAMIREIKEEVGLDVIAYQYNDNEYFEKTNTLIHNYEVIVESEDFVLNEEVDKAKWYPVEEVLQVIKPHSLAKSFVERCFIKNQTEVA